MFRRLAWEAPPLATDTSAGRAFTFKLNTVFAQANAQKVQGAPQLRSSEAKMVVEQFGAVLSSYGVASGQQKSIQSEKAAILSICCSIFNTRKGKKRLNPGKGG